MKGLIALCSADTDFFLLFAHILESAGYRITLAKTLDDLNSFESTSDVAGFLLDARGSFPAVEACQIIKNKSALSQGAIIAILAGQTPPQYLDLISAGVDETFVRPFAPGKLLEYLHRQVSHNRELARRPGTLRHSGVVVDLDQRTVTRNGAPIHLAPTEFSLLVHLMTKPGRICSRVELLDAAWPDRRFVEAPTLNVHINRLRKALNRFGEPDLIRTVRYVGYAFGSARSEGATPEAAPAKEKKGP
ncbi:two-component system phosphate regulon response regulator PhoB [Pseudorhizobium tarimense]|uniref:Two-component system phosphate regulon response regulator PhoB n=1 Tax=Pseudorhizobium tarimense TaxID=1079109 RepID=A0ABV2HC33_9HYPH|nr:response regulator transcription factor [Pseudorhizobium tarimense]MCJ8521141.1 response regulator transcription factor [Pseudorhizobium tarimense]